MNSAADARLAKKLLLPRSMTSLKLIIFFRNKAPPKAKLNSLKFFSAIFLTVLTETPKSIEGLNRDVLIPRCDPIFINRFCFLVQFMVGY